MFIEKRFAHWVQELRSQVALPLRLELWNGQYVDFSPNNPAVTIRVPQPSALSYLLRPSLLNLGTAYVEGKIEVKGRSAEMIAIVTALAGNLMKQEGRITRLFNTTARHTRSRDAEAIRYHYDVSNDFYAQWLDDNMVYSCAYFENGDETLDSAQLKKIDHILAKIRLQPGQRLLDIGCGWGALVIRAAQKYGVHCVGITLSENQYLLARERVRRAGLERQVDIRLQDYRDLNGSYDRITSVGMFEHVGLRHLTGYFSKINSLLEENGIALNHGITSADPENRESPYGGGQFIEKYVFPQGELPHIGLVLKSMQEGGLETLDVENLRRHYARTCGIWAENFEKNAPAIKRTTDDRHFRIWHIYLAGSAYAFANDWISLYQVLCMKGGRDAAQLPWSRRYMYASPTPEKVPGALLGSVADAATEIRQLRQLL
jgi:cyclopropane-fatty-acyl-phospholipid synthase